MSKRENKNKRGISENNSNSVNGSRQNPKTSFQFNKYIQKKWLLALAIFIFSFLLYIPSLENGFVWDDVISIEKRNYKFQKSNIKSLVIPPERENNKANYFRPLIFASLVFDYQIWGENPFGYHLTNNLLYSLSSLLFFFLILLILKEFHIGSKEYIAAMAAVIYVIHPMHVESVAWISGRTDIICTLFFLAAFVFHILSYKNLVFLPLTILMLLASFLSKEIAVAFPFVVLVFDLLKSKKIRLRSVYISLFYFVLMAVYLVIRARAFTIVPEFSPRIIDLSQGSPAEFVHYLQSLAVILNSYMFYFIKLVFPFKFNAFVTEVPKTGYYTFFSVLIFALLSIFTYISIKFRSGLKAFSFVWIILTLGPSVLISIFQVSTTPLAERYLFLPIGGFSVLIAYTVYPYLIKYKSYRFFTVFLLICCLLSAFSVSRQSVWKDRAAFWDDISAKSNDSDIAKLNQGIALIEENRIDEGLKVAKTIFRPGSRAPDFIKAIASNNIGIAYLKKGKTGIAKKWFLKGIQFDPGFHKSYFHLAIIDYSAARKNNSMTLFKRSEKNAKKALRAKKNYSRAYLLLAKIYLKYNDSKQAKRYAKIALNLGLEKPLQRQAKKILELHD